MLEPVHRRVPRAQRFTPIDLPNSPAAERNKDAILQVLRGVLPARGTALEIASGTGQHVACFASALADWHWQPTEGDPSLLPAIAARIAQEGLHNVQAPLLLDVTAPQWPLTQHFDAIFCANMLHISPWAACAALMQGAARHLAPGGVLVTYGPYFEEGVPAAPSNVAFDASLRARDPAWGIRRLQGVAGQARSAGLELRARHAMPANNLLLEFGWPPRT
jgi:SAM-dependent methyltransferase